jgi:hypothetical protein
MGNRVGSSVARTCRAFFKFPAHTALKPHSHHLFPLPVFLLYLFFCFGLLFFCFWWICTFAFPNSHISLVLSHPASHRGPCPTLSRPAALQSIHNHTRHARAHPPRNRMMRVPCRKPCERACAKAPYKTRGPIPSPDRLFRRARGAAVQAQERGQEEGVLAGTGCGVVEG